MPSLPNGPKLTRFHTETRSKTRAIFLDIDLADLLAAEEAERIQRLEEGYESEDSLVEEDEDEGDSGDDEDWVPDPEVFGTRPELPDDLGGLDEQIFYDCQSLLRQCLDGPVPDLTDSEDEISAPSPLDSLPSPFHPSDALSSNNEPPSVAPMPTASMPPSSSSSLDASSSNNKKRKKRGPGRTAYKKRLKADARNAKRAKASDGPYSKKVSLKRLEEAEVVFLDIDAANFPAASTGWQGVRTGKLFTHLTRKEILERVRYIDWDAT